MKLTLQNDRLKQSQVEFGNKSGTPETKNLSLDPPKNRTGTPNQRTFRMK